MISDLEGDQDDFLEAMKVFRSHKHRMFVISPFGPWFETKTWDLSPTDRIIGEAIQEGLVSQRKEVFKMVQKFDAAAISVGPDDMLANVMTEFQKLKQRS
jgi:hypothetical protein